MAELNVDSERFVGAVSRLVTKPQTVVGYVRRMLLEQAAAPASKVPELRVPGLQR